MKDIKIRDVKVILTEPDNIRLVIVKIETSEPELYGLGCATFHQRPLAVASAVNDYLKPLLINKSPHNIEDIWQYNYQSSYWKNGSVLNNAISGVDQALWDIKGKIAGLPLYDLFGGKTREAAAVYAHASGKDIKEVEEHFSRLMEEGYHHIRVQVGTPGFAGYGAEGNFGGERHLQDGPKWITKRNSVPQNKQDYNKKTSKNPRGIEGIFEPKPYVRSALKLLDHIRSKFGFEIEILHDVHQRIPPILGVWMAKEVEKYQLFFLEDLFAPEDNDYFRIVRQQCSTPIAMGELYNNPSEYIPMIKDRLIDFIRIHISDIGGLTPAKKLAGLCEAFGVRTAWHGPGDTSPVGHAANLMLDISSWNFGIQEYSIFGERTKEVFPGCPEVKDGFMWPNDKPGLGIEINEELALKFPHKEREMGGGMLIDRRADGSVNRP
ncbi:MAG TPA: enolase C-terminal domain-like protein [Dehalococcoidia bacterium]|jgi:mannonate dehydratase|nr:enolase C-terminal domain-like protein [Dehalococcoidia bacterium]